MTYHPESDEEAKFLALYDPSKFPIITVTVDVIALHRRPNKDWKVLLIERKNWPYRGDLAFPGGFIDETETAREAASRELMEETHWAVMPEELTAMEAASTPDRDPRGRVITLPFIYQLSWDGKPPTVKPGDDAVDATWCKLGDVDLSNLAFDHAVTLKKAVAMADEFHGLKRNLDTWKLVK